MLDRTDFASWQQRIRLYCQGKENGVNILKSIDEGSFQMGTFRETLAEGTKGAPHLGPERPRVYSDLSPKDKERYNADIRAINILLQGLPKDIYSLINHYTDEKDIWDNNIKMTAVQNAAKLQVYKQHVAEWGSLVDRIEVRGTMHGVEVQLVMGEHRTELGANPDKTVADARSGEWWVALACSFMLCDLDFEPLSLSLLSLPSCDLMSLTNMLILLHYLESFKSELAEAEEGLANFAPMAYTSQGSSSSSSSDSEYDVQVKDISIKDLKNHIEEALKEKDDLKLKLEKFEESLKNLTKLINSQISAKDKIDLGYDSQMNDSEVIHNVFNSRESDVDDSPVNDRFKIGEGFHAVPPPYTGNYMLPRPDLSFAGPSAPIIEEWDTNNDNDSVFRPKSDQTKPKFTKINFVKSSENVKSVNKENIQRQVEYPRKSQSPRDNRRKLEWAVANKSGTVSVNAAKQKLSKGKAASICTDIAKIIRKRSKPDKHGHGKGKENTRAGRMLSKVNKIKAVEESCVTCGGAHAWYNCSATDNNQASVCATTGTYNQVNPPNRVSNQMAPPGFAPVQNNDQNSYKRNNDKMLRNMQNQINSLKGDLKNEIQNTIKSQQAVMMNQQTTFQNNLQNMICGLFQNQASTSGTLPSNTIPNPKGEMKAITTRSGVAYEGPSIPTNPSPKKVVERETEETTDKEQTNFQGSTAQIPPPVIPISIPEPDVPKTLPKTTPIPESDIPKSLPKPNIPYPSRRDDQKSRDKASNQMEKIFQIFQDLRFDISFADALLLMPRFAPTIKSLLMNKEKLLELAKIPLNENCSAMLLKKLPEKLGDPGKFLIPCNFPGMDVCHALADLGASINLMPLSIWKKLSLPELTPTRMTLELADRSITHPKGLAEDIFVKVGKFYFPTDFVVVDFEADPRVPLILGRSFFRTSRALIDVYEGELVLRDGNEQITFHVNGMSKHPQKHVNESIKMVNGTCKDSFKKFTNEPTQVCPPPPEDVNNEKEKQEVKNLAEPRVKRQTRITPCLKNFTVVCKESMNDSKNVLPSCDDFSSIKDPRDDSVTFCNPLFEFDVNFNSNDINPLFDEELEDIECKDSYDSNLDKSTFTHLFFQ
ncbi:reverse transcriptase domain-containing protein [Tanacetum coccineum]